MNEKKVDLRILKTRKAIKEAFLSLVNEKGYERMTVQDIADEAMINRNTFYLHYLDKQDLMSQLCLEGILIFKECRQSKMNELTVEALKTMLTSILKNIEANIELFKIMLSPNMQPEFTLQLKEVLKQNILNGEEYEALSTNKKMALEYIISGSIGVICLWVANFESMRVEEVIDGLSTIHFHNGVALFNS